MSLRPFHASILLPLLFAACHDARDPVAPSASQKVSPIAGPLSTRGPVPIMGPGASGSGPQPLFGSAEASTSTSPATTGASPELVWQHTVSGERSMWHMQGTAWDGTSPLPQVATAWDIAGAGDFTGDGQQDLVWQNTATGERSVWHMKASSWPGAYTLLPQVAPAWEIAAAADFTSDGKPDLVWQNNQTGERSIWVMQGTTYTGQAMMLPTVPIAWKIAAAADFNGNGSPDLVWQNMSTGERSIWLMQGTVYTQQFATLPTVPVQWEIAAAGDFTGDGSPDLVWQNTSTGERSIWHMQGTTYSGTHTALPTVAKEWRIATAGRFGRAQNCAPAESNHHQSYTAFWRAPFGFKGATPWLSAVQKAGSTAGSTVEIDYIRLWARINGVAQIVARNEYTDAKAAGELRLRNPWYGGSWRSMPVQITNGALVIHPSSSPNDVWHPYLESWPDLRADISGADSVWMEARVRVQGPALVQGGLDAWKNLDYAANRVYEVGATDWVCASGDWQTLRMTRGTEVVGSIQVSAPQGLAVGKPVTAAFTLGNFDDDAVLLSDVGVDVRVKNSSDPYCDPDISSTPAYAYTFATQVQLAPGQTRAHSATWTPSAPGTYCLQVVEKRPSNPYYQRTYSSVGSQVIVIN